MNDDPRPCDPDGPDGGVPPGSGDRGSAAEEGALFDPEESSGREAAHWINGPEGEDSTASHTSRVLIGTGRSGIDAASDVMPEASSEGPGPRFLEDIEGAAGERKPTAETTGTPPDADEWHDVAEAGRDAVASESTGFGPFLSTQEAADQGGMADSCAGDSQGVGDGVAPALDFKASASTGRDVRRSSSRRDAGPGQIVGVILGGVLAIPVTLAILLWGFQRDPLGIAAGIPEPLRFLLPRKLRVVSTSGTTPVRTSSPGLDTVAAEAARAAATGRPSLPAPDPSAPIEQGVAGDPSAEPTPSEDRAAVVTALDQVVIPLEPPPIDVGKSGARFEALDEAVARGLAATDGIDALSDDRDAALVAWYRDLADAAREASAAERRAMEAGSPAGDVVARLDPLARRLLESHLGTLETLGAMWLSSVRRPSDGVLLAATLEESKAVGPWWGGKLSIRGDAPRSVVFLCGLDPRAMPGDRILVVGVLVDPGTMWLVAAWPAPATDH